MPGLDPGIHAVAARQALRPMEWIAGSSPAMTKRRRERRERKTKRRKETHETDRHPGEPLTAGANHALRRGPDLPVVSVRQCGLPARQGLPRRRARLREADDRLARGH